MNTRRVIVAMSGGVDSSVAALLLQKQDFEIVGVHFRQGDYTGGCCGDEGLADARRVAQQLGIYFYVINCQEEFNSEVIDYFCRTYAGGKTPNPCIYCNARVRFPILVGLADFLGFDYIATGHYARIKFDHLEDCHYITKASDSGKDQTYFLINLRRNWLGRIIFPLGSLSKAEVREIARKRKLKVSDKPESQDICFIPRADYSEFLRNTVPQFFPPGPVLDREGRKLGMHSGLPFYTVGQRKGLGISSPHPYYVLKLDLPENTLYVGKEEDTYSSRMVVSECNWLAKTPGKGKLRASIKIRSRHLGAPGRDRKSVV